MIVIDQHNMPITNGARFDFVVVGGGTAGNVVANRLAESPKYTTRL